MTHPQPETPSKAALWGGRVMSALPVLALVASAAMKFARPPDAIANFTHLGYDVSIVGILGAVELVSTALYLIPQTAILGAILLTGYLGGAVATHVRVGEPKFVIPIVFGVLLWGGLWLRDERVRKLIPLRNV